MHSFSKASSDSELAKAVAKSNLTAFKILHDRYFEALFRFLFRRTKHEETAKDLLQELFLKVWENRQILDSKRSVKSYFFKIAHNLAIDHLRRKLMIAAHSSNHEQSSKENPEDDDVRISIKMAIDELPQPSKEEFIMKRFDGFKYREIAELLGISIKTVESRMSKALKKLHEQLRSINLMIF